MSPSFSPTAPYYEVPRIHAARSVTLGFPHSHDDASSRFYNLTFVCFVPFLLEMFLVAMLWSHLIFKPYRGRINSFLCHVDVGGCMIQGVMEAYSCTFSVFSCSFVNYSLVGVCALLAVRCCRLKACL